MENTNGIPYKKSGPAGVALFMVPVAGLDLHFRPGMGENKGVAAVEAGGKQRSSALHINGFDPALLSTKKRDSAEALSLFLVPVAGLDLHFRPGMGENKGVAAAETGGKQRSSALHLNRFEPNHPDI